jgi:hypothetical protein
MVVVEHGVETYLLDAPFDDQIDDYSDSYAVYRLPGDVRARLATDSWETLPSLGERLGRVAVSAVRFDKTRRRYVDAGFLGALRKSN